ncbi:hypothetical protein LJK87_22685 [Paenibacillus sp. P25]|nr:hypothetical protein LJK87_22685 [Paenibacillus sp. P25]
MANLYTESDAAISDSARRRAKSVPNRYVANIRKHWILYLMIVPGLVYYIVFKYVPLAGSVIAFQNYQIFKGMLGSSWVGLDNFKFIFTYQDFYHVLRNTATIALYQLLFGFPAPIILAPLFNEVRLMLFKRVVQSLFYLPHFLSWVVVGGIVFEPLSNQGVVNMVRGWFGYEPVLFMQQQAVFSVHCRLVGDLEGCRLGHDHLPCRHCRDQSEFV